MRSHYRQVAKGIGLVAAGGFLMGGIGTTCTSVAGTTALGGVDFCFIFDCQNALGGTVDLCDQYVAIQEGQVIGGGALLADCPTRE